MLLRRVFLERRARRARGSRAETASIARTAIVAGVIVALTFACSSSDNEIDDNNFREDVITCEEAVARLSECCPNFDAGRLRCDYYYARLSGCGAASTESVQPVLSTAESTCVRTSSCDDLVKNRVCERAQVAEPYRQTNTSIDNDDASVASSSSTHPPVCP